MIIFTVQPAYNPQVAGRFRKYENQRAAQAAPKEWI